jgi:cardiolipin synthase A/B
LATSAVACAFFFCTPLTWKSKNKTKQAIAAAGSPKIGNPNTNYSLGVSVNDKLAGLEAAAASAADALVAQLPAVSGELLTGAVKDVELFVEPDAGVAPVLAFIASAQETLDFNIYQLNDTDVQAALVAAAARGVAVRVIMTWQTFPAKSDLYDPTNKDVHNPNVEAANMLRAGGVAVQWSPFWYVYSHEKAMVADGKVPGKGRALIMDFNSIPSYFTGTRGFGVIDTDPLDVAEIQAVFDADWAYKMPLTYASKNLFWSPNGVGYKPLSMGANRVLGLFSSAKYTLDVYALLVDWPPFVDGLCAAAARGVTVRVLGNCGESMINNTYVPDCGKPYMSGISPVFQDRMEACGIQLRQGARGGDLFIHTKTLIRDAGTPHALATVSSENPGDYVSMNAERELGIFLSNSDIVATLSETFNTDWASASPLP